MLVLTSSIYGPMEAVQSSINSRSIFSEDFTRSEVLAKLLNLISSLSACILLFVSWSKRCVRMVESSSLFNSSRQKDLKAAICFNLLAISSEIIFYRTALVLDFRRNASSDRRLLSIMLSSLDSVSLSSV